MRRLFSLVICSGFVVLTVLAPQRVSAQATNELAIFGPAESCPLDNPPCENVMWTGTVTIVTSSGANGVYSGASFLSLLVDSSLFSATSDGLNFDNGVPVPGDFASVTLSNGWITSFDFTYANQPNFELAVFQGLSGHYSRSGAPDGLTISAFTIITNIPEPEVFSLMLAGLLLTSVVQGTRKSKL